MINYPEFNNPRDIRLAVEHKLIDEICQGNTMINYQCFSPVAGKPPDTYLITYNVRSIIGINPDQSPIYQNGGHQVEIKLPANYPDFNGPPSCKTITDIWHPNIRWHNTPKGRICINSNELGAWHSLDMLIIMIGSMLQYKNYHALNIKPYPEDIKVAQWVRNYAEPSIVNYNLGICVDDRPLITKERLELIDWGESEFRKKTTTNTVLTEFNDDMSFTTKSSSNQSILPTEDDMDMEFKIK